MKKKFFKENMENKKILELDSYLERVPDRNQQEQRGKI